MSDLGTLIASAAELRASGEPFVVATVVRVSGSAYRRPGARMLFTRERWIAGSVSGGCLEHDLLEKGWWKTRDGKPALVTYDARSEDDLGWGLGLGCEGLVEVLLEPACHGPLDAIAFITDCRARQRRGALATVFDGDGAPRGAHIALGPDESMSRDEMASESSEALLVECRRALAQGKSMVVTCASPAGTVHALVEVVLPPPRLFLIGTRHDALPVTKLARSLGWEVVVVDSSGRFSTRERFAEANAILAVVPESFNADLRAHVDATDRALAVVMAHDYERDRACLAALLETRALYIGMLGPRDRTARMARELGIERLDERVHAPVGLALGAETPQEIALAIVAEAQSVLTSSIPVRLREIPGPIHRAAPMQLTELKATG
jgi:xanthine dehydrogenase accessory factor